MATLFTTLIENDLANFVYTDPRCVAFLDINPAAPGHCLVVPRQETDQWTDIDEGLMTHLMSVAKKIGEAQKSVFGCERVGVMIAGFEVPHCHIHVIPANSMADFELGAHEASDEQLSEHRSLLQAALG